MGQKTKKFLKSSRNFVKKGRRPNISLGRKGMRTMAGEKESLIFIRKRNSYIGAVCINIGPRHLI